MLKTAPFYASVPVRDLARARRFYEETLGLGPANIVGPALSFACGNGTLCLMYVSPASGSTCAFWHVDDVERVAAWLRSRGVEMEQVGEGAAWFRDCEGNRMAVMQQPSTRRAQREAAPREEAAVAA